MGVLLLVVSVVLAVRGRGAVDLSPATFWWRQLCTDTSARQGSAFALKAPELFLGTST